MKNFEPNEQRRIDLKKLLEYVSKLTNGQRQSWLEAERATSVRMDQRGRSLLRLALRRAKRPYLALPALGFEMSAADNSLEIVGVHTRRFVGSLTILRETSSQVATRHLGEMSEEQKTKLIHHQAVLDTLSLNASLTKGLPAK